MTVQRKSHRAPSTPKTSDDTDPAELPEPPLSRSTYEVRIKGTLPPLLLHGLEDADVTTGPSETILHRPAGDQDSLGDFLDELHNLGLTIFELHRLPDPVPSLAQP